MEAYDGLASAAHLAVAEETVQKACIWKPDKDLPQCVRGDRVVQVDRKGNKILRVRDSARSSGGDPS